MQTGPRWCLRKVKPVFGIYYFWHPQALGFVSFLYGVFMHATFYYQVIWYEIQLVQYKVYYISWISHS